MAITTTTITEIKDEDIKKHIYTDNNKKSNAHFQTELIQEQCFVFLFPNIYALYH